MHMYRKESLHQDKRGRDEVNEHELIKLSKNFMPVQTGTKGGPHDIIYPTLVQLLMVPSQDGIEVFFRDNRVQSM